MTAAKILQIAQMADALLGSEAGRVIIAALAKDRGLTQEQKDNLDRNYEDNVQRIARLKAELGET
jgi:hypothetical protein